MTHADCITTRYNHTYTYPYTRNLNLPIVGVRKAIRPRRLQNDDISRAY